MSDQLTKYKQGSLKELWTLAYPMILAFLSGNMMLFADRLFLSNYSLSAMNAAAAAGIVIAVIQYGSAIITSIAEVFVGQLNGSKKYKEVAGPAWQMLWFSAALVGIFVVLARWGGPYLLPEYHYHDHALPYYQYLLYFGAATPAIAAFSGFFVGIGKTRHVMVITLFGNLLNIALDPILIFGIQGILSPMGTKGAAIATVISMLTQLIAFAIIFFQKKYRAQYGTTNWQINPSQLFKCLKVGFPNAIGHMIEWTAWAITIQIMARAGEHYLTVATIGQSMYMLIAFGFEGVQKAVTTLAANLIGANKQTAIWPVWRSSIKLLLLFAIPFGALMLGYPELVINQFFPAETPIAEINFLMPLLRVTAGGVLLYYLVDGFAWICVGVLTAAEDTWFVMWVNAITAWMCGLLPIYLCMVQFHWSPAWYFILMSLYGIANALIFYRRLNRKVLTINAQA